MNKILMKGNDALSEAAIRAGCRFYAGYPITPQNEIPEYMARRMPEVGGVFIQAESEISAINMVYGASAAGARAMTSSSSPGISLKQEGISYLAGAELPAVIANIQRGGPGLGNISASQSDYFQATKGGGHGDYRLLVYAPSSVQEMFDLTIKAFDKADEYRNPVMILGDGIIGQMMEPVIIKHVPDQVKETEEGHTQYKKDWALTGCNGRTPNVIKTLFMEEGALEDRNLKLKEKYESMKKNEVMYESLFIEDAEIVVVAFGIAARISSSAIIMARNQGIKAGLFRPITLFPFPENELRMLADQGKRFLTVEMNLGQMVEDVRLSVEGRGKVDFYGRAGGAILTTEEIFWAIKGPLI